MLMNIIFPIYEATLNVSQSMNTLNRETDQVKYNMSITKHPIFKETWDLPE